MTRSTAQQVNREGHIFEEKKVVLQDNPLNDGPPSCVLLEPNPYDVHVYYESAEERKAAMELRQKLRAAFGWMKFYNPVDRPIGPHPVPMWEADFADYNKRDQWPAVRDFLLENNPKNLSILIHPNSTDGGYVDHTEHAFWAGKALDLRLEPWRK